MDVFLRGDTDLTSTGEGVEGEEEGVAGVAKVKMHLGETE